MYENEQDAQMREALRDYRVPPEPPLDAMWEAIEAKHYGRPIAAIGGSAGERARRRWGVGAPTWATLVIGMAATLLVGVGIGRMSNRLSPALEDVAYTRAEGFYSCSTMSCEGSDPLRDATTEYLGRTAALLTALPSEVRAGLPDSRFVNQASDLLSTTRLLIDAPSTTDPRLISLLEDLELVLAQIARLPANRGAAELDLITEALEQRDVVPRLRSAVVDISSADN